MESKLISAHRSLPMRTVTTPHGPCAIVRCAFALWVPGDLIFAVSCI
jgi:hypothetical protein